jgi:hypothetical protein
MNTDAIMTYPLREKCPTTVPITSCFWPNAANRTIHVLSAPTPSPTQAAYGTPNTNKPGYLLMHDSLFMTCERLSQQ